jgi:AAA domain
VNLGKELVTAIVFDDDLDPVLSAGLNLDWLSDPTGGSGALFVSPVDRQAFKLILEQYAKHSKVMTRDRLEEHLPGYEWGEDESTLPELIEDCIKAIKRDILTLAISNVDTDLSDGRIDTAAESITAWAQKLNDTIVVNDRKILVLEHSDLESLEDPDPLIEGFLDTGQLTSIYGRWGQGKSFIVLDWACHLATGKNWQGHHTERGRVLYIAAEGGWGQKFRVRAWQDKYGRIPKGMLWFIVQPMQLVSAEHIAFLVKLIQDKQIDLVIVDTQARATVGLDENSAQDMGQVIENTSKLRDGLSEGRTAILLVHHAGKDGKDRGSSAMPGAYDNMYRVEHITDDVETDPITEGNVRLTCLKRKDGEPAPPMDLKAIKCRGSIVFEPLADPESPDRRAFTLQDHLDRYHPGSSPAGVRDCLNNLRELGVLLPPAGVHAETYRWKTGPQPCIKGRNKVRDQREETEEAASEAAAKHFGSRRPAKRRSR